MIATAAQHAYTSGSAPWVLLGALAGWFVWAVKTG